MPFGLQFVEDKAFNRIFVMNGGGNHDWHFIYTDGRAQKGDARGNLVYRKAARNFGPIMAAAAKCTIAQVREVVPLGALDPEVIVTPGIFVRRVVSVQ